MVVLIVALLPQRAKSEELDSNVIEEFALAPRDMLPVVPVTIQGKTYTFMVDTGSTVNVFDPSLANLLTPSKMWDSGPSKFVLYECAGAVIGSPGIEMAPLAAVVKLEALRRYAKLDIRGLVGMNTLRDHRIQLDFDAGHLRFLKSSRDVEGPQLDLRFTSSNMPTLTMKIPETADVAFTIDTGKVGGEFGFIKEELFKWLVHKDQLKQQQGIMLGAIFREEVEMPIGVLSTQFSGSLTWKGGIFAVGRINSLGLGFLSQHIATFDFPNSKLHLASRKQAVPEQIVNESGLQVMTVGKFGVCVTEADPTGLGFAAGLRIGDIISEIDGTPVKDLPFTAVGYPLRNPSGKCLVHFQSSDGRERSVDLAAFRKKPNQIRDSGAKP